MAFSSREGLEPVKTITHSMEFGLQYNTSPFNSGMPMNYGRVRDASLPDPEISARECIAVDSGNRLDVGGIGDR